MKKLFSVLIVTALVIGLFTAAHVEAAGDFTVQNGLLVSYNGTDVDVTVPDGVTVIGDSAFEGKKQLERVTLPSSVYTIGDRAFCGCSALAAVEGGDNVTRCGVHAFRNTPYLDDSTDKYLMLGKTLLWYNGNTASVTVPVKCASVAPYAFARCDTITSFRAQGGLVSIGDGAFYDCQSLSSVELPSSVSEVGAYAFEGTPYLASLGEFPTVGDGVLLTYAGSSTDVRIPSSVRRIAPAAFMGLSKLESVEIPSSVYSVDPYAFADCVGLSDVTFNDGLVNIGDGAFRGCTSLTQVTTPDTLAYLGQHAFDGDSALEEAYLCGDRLIVSYNAFKGSGLKFALLGRGVDTLYDGAFNNCEKLKGVSVPPETTQIGANAIVGCPQVTVSCKDGSDAAVVFARYRSDTLKGDVDSDGELTIVDSTSIQRYLAYMIPFNGMQAACSDIDYDAEVSVTDATLIQMILAKMIAYP